MYYSLGELKAKKWQGRESKKEDFCKEIRAIKGREKKGIFAFQKFMLSRQKNIYL